MLRLQQLLLQICRHQRHRLRDKHRGSTEERGGRVQPLVR